MPALSMSWFCCGSSVQGITLFFSLYCCFTLNNLVAKEATENLGKAEGEVMVWVWRC